VTDCIVVDQDVQDLGETLAPQRGTRIQLCGRLTARIEGRRVEEGLPGRQGRLLFVYLAVHRRRPATRSELMQALWPDRLPAAADTALSALLTKLRGVLGPGAVVGKQDVRLVLPADAWIDLEAANEGLHRATSAVAQHDWARAWGPSRVALHVAQRGFLPGYEAPWIDEVRGRVDEILVRAHECVAGIGLGLAGSELASAERSARALIKLAPYRETGYRFLMEVHAGQGNIAEALLTYERLRRLLREELGANPGPAAQALHKRLIQGDGAAQGDLVREIRTVLFTDIVGSTELAAKIGDRAWRELSARHHTVVRGAIERFGGCEIDTAGDGFFVTFDSPVRAVTCCSQMIKGVAAFGITLRAGLHTGECEVFAGRLSGIAVHVGARISALASPGAILASSTVKDLMVGSGIGFHDRGTQTLRGVPGEWRLFEVDAESISQPAE
jgi:class 3 adenylate cyclase